MTDPDLPVSSELLDLTRWAADYYLCSWGEVLGAASGGAIASGAMDFRLRRLDWTVDERAGISLTPSERRVLKHLSVSRGATVVQLTQRGINRRALNAALKRLEQRGLIEREWRARRPRS